MSKDEILAGIINSVNRYSRDIAAVKQTDIPLDKVEQHIDELKCRYFDDITGMVKKLDGLEGMAEWN